MVKKILITGATGYIGSHVAKKLIEKGYQVCALIRQASDIHKYPLPSSVTYAVHDGTTASIVEIFREQKPDCVIHLAARFIAEHQSSQVETLLEDNIVYSTNIFEGMKVSGCPYIINTTSSWEHYQGQTYNPVCLYAATKRAVTDILKYYCETGQITATTLCIYDTYGPNDRRGKLIGKFFEIAESGAVLPMSEGQQHINYVFIDDVVEAYIHSVGQIEQQTEHMRTYYLRSEETYTLRELSLIFEKAVHKHLHIEWGKRPYRAREVMEVYSGGERLPGWEAHVSLEEGLRRIAEENLCVPEGQSEIETN